MMSDRLRAILAAHLEPFTHGGTVNAELGAILDILTPVVKAAIHEARRPPGTCRECWEPTAPDGFTHHMSCSQRVGPVQHNSSGSGYNPTTKTAKYYCTCGTEWTATYEPGDARASETCPNAAETWRGPQPADKPPPALP